MVKTEAALFGVVGLYETLYLIALSGLMYLTDDNYNVTL